VIVLNHQKEKEGKKMNTNRLAATHKKFEEVVIECFGELEDIF
jgi:hypothetical protein